MAGPIRDLLARQPVRNTVRALLGMPARYGNMGTSLDAVSATDAMQGADVMARPRRLMRRRGLVNPQAEMGTTAMTVAPSPEAKAVADAREQDSQRRVQTRRASEMKPAASQPEGPAQDPATPVTPVASAMPSPEPAAPSTSTTSANPNPMQFRIDQLYSRAAQTRQEAERLRGVKGFDANPSLIAQHNQFLRSAELDETRADMMNMQGLQRQQTLDDVARAEEHELAKTRITNPPDTLASNAADLAATVREQGILVATKLMADTWAKANGTTDPQLIKQQELLYGMANSGTALAQRLKARQAPVEGDPMIAEIAQIVSQLGTDEQSRAMVVTRIVGAAQQQSPGLSGQQAAALSRQLSAIIEKQLAGATKTRSYYDWWKSGYQSGGN